MSATTESSPASETLAAVGRSWGLLLFLGIITLLLGIAAVAWPQATVLVIAVLFGVYLLVTGIFQVIRSFSAAEHKALLAISGIVSILLAIFAFKSFFNSVALLAIWFGIAWLFRGITELVVGFQAKGESGRGWMITSGILGILGAIVIFIWPAASLVVVVWVTGIMLIVLGIAQIVGSFSVKKAANV